MNMENMIEKAKENKMSILGVIGTIAAVLLGKKMHDRKKGSGAYRFQLPMDGSKMPEEEAFFAFKQRDGIAPNGSAMNRMQWMNRYSESGYSKGTHGKKGRGQQAWSSWSESLVPSDDEGQWSGAASQESQLFGGAFGNSISDSDEGQWSGAASQESQLFGGDFGSSISENDEGQWGGSTGSTDSFSSDFFPATPKF